MPSVHAVLRPLNSMHGSIDYLLSFLLDVLQDDGDPIATYFSMEGGCGGMEASPLAPISFSDAGPAIGARTVVMKQGSGLECERLECGACATRNPT